MSAVQQVLDLGEGYKAIVETDRWNPLAERRELKLIIEHVAKPTPTRCFVREAVARALNVDKKMVVVKKLVTEFGVGRTHVRVNIYKTEERMRYMEDKKSLKLNEECG